jgi:hypothetical protein
VFTARYGLDINLGPAPLQCYSVTCPLIPDSAVRNSDHSTHAAGPGDWLSSAPGWLKAMGIPDVSAARCKEPPSPRTPCPARHGAVFNLTGCPPRGADGLATAQWNTKHCTSTVGRHMDNMRHVPYVVRSAIGQQRMAGEVY